MSSFYSVPKLRYRPTIAIINTFAAVTKSFKHNTVDNLSIYVCLTKYILYTKFYLPTMF